MIITRVMNNKEAELVMKALNEFSHTHRMTKEGQEAFELLKSYKVQYENEKKKYALDRNSP